MMEVCRVCFSLFLVGYALLDIIGSHIWSISSCLLIDIKNYKYIENNLEQKEDIEILVNILQRSNYPKNEIHHIIKDTLSRNNNQHPNNKIENDQEQFTHTLTLFYTSEIEILKRKLKKFQIKLMYSYPKKLQTQINPNKKATSNSVIYQIE